MYDPTVGFTLPMLSSRNSGGYACVRRGIDSVREFTTYYVLGIAPGKG